MILMSDDDRKTLRSILDELPKLPEPEPIPDDAPDEETMERIERMRKRSTWRIDEH